MTRRAGGPSPVPVSASVVSRRSSVVSRQYQSSILGRRPPGPAEGHQSLQSSFTALPPVAPQSGPRRSPQTRCCVLHSASGCASCLYDTHRPPTVPKRGQCASLHIFIYYIFRNKHATELNRHLLFTMAKDLRGSGGPGHIWQGGPCVRLPGTDLRFDRQTDTRQTARSAVPPLTHILSALCKALCKQ